MLLKRLCREKSICDPSCLGRSIGREVTVFGLGKALEEELEEKEIRGTLMAADGAVEVLMDRGIRPDIITTDLDGPIHSQVKANVEGAVVVVLAHGDNMASIREQVPEFQGKITPTSQSRPPQGLYNFGGFTDGDRAVVIARHFGAQEIRLIGFDFEDPRPIEGKDAIVKSRKLQWARKIIFDMNLDGVSIIR